MNSILFIAFVCLSQFGSLSAATKLTIDEQPYLSTTTNLTSTAELKSFFTQQSAVYIDNVYSAYERFFYRLLASLPKVERRAQIKAIVEQFDKLLRLADETEKLSAFQVFMVHYENELNEIFIYEKEQTRLTPGAFSQIYVDEGVEELLAYETQYQLKLFEAQIGNGIRRFLVANRASLTKNQILEFKKIVESFLETSQFFEKIVILKNFVTLTNKILSFNFFK